MSGFRFSVRELFLLTLVAALVFGWGSQSYIRSRPSSHERALMQERLQALKQAADSYQSPRVGVVFGPKAVRDARCEVLAAELELCTTTQDRLKILEKLLEVQQLYEQEEAARYEKGAGTAHEFLSAKADRLKVEIALERAKTGR